MPDGFTKVEKHSYGNKSDQVSVSQNGISFGGALVEEFDSIDNVVAYANEETTEMAFQPNAGGEDSYSVSVNNQISSTVPLKQLGIDPPEYAVRLPARIEDGLIIADASELADGD